ncbi:hypothetical protein LTS17_000852 [Exophiala oligosperma]
MADSTAENNYNNDAEGKKKPRQRTERKKIQDRLAQRANRERTKQRIAALEEALNSLQSGDDPSCTASLTRTIANLRNNNHQLRYTLDRIRSLVDQVPLVPEGDAGGTDPDFAPWASSPDAKFSESKQPVAFIPEVQPTGAALAQGNAFELDHPITISTPTKPSPPRVTVTVPPGTACAAPEEGVLENGTCGEDILTTKGTFADNVLVTTADTMSDHDTTADKVEVDHFDLDLLDVFDQTDMGIWNTYEPAALFKSPSSNLEIAGGIVPDTEKWHLGNSAYFGALDSVKRRVKSASTMDFQVAFQAMLWGWQNVGHAAEHPVWYALREVDQRIFGTWTSVAQRIAMVFVCQTLIQYREDPTPENLSRVPGFLRPRPSQERLAHPVVIDFLIWPGMRDRMVFEHEKYSASGLFSAAYVENFSFFWPYSDKEIFVYDPFRDRHEFSPVFLQHVYNYENWTMKPGFFERCPEMRYDVPVFQRSSSMFQPVASY